MANAIYPKWKEAILNGGSNVALNGTVRATLVDLADYTYGAAHEFITSVPAGAGVAPTLEVPLLGNNSVLYPPVVEGGTDTRVVRFDLGFSAGGMTIGFAAGRIDIETRAGIVDVGCAAGQISIGCSEGHIAITAETGRTAIDTTPIQ